MPNPRAIAAIGIAGLLTAIVGMCLPWLRSGAVLRDSFEFAGVIQTLGFLRGQALEWLLMVWYGLIPAMVLGVGLYLVSRRAAATFLLLVAIILGTIAGVARVEAGSGPVGVAEVGPTVTVIGAALVMAAALGTLFGGRGRARENAGGER
ncbi:MULTISPECIES: hypothetical protein [Actinokineospora]|uniref:hypothetical protein n=1 Tax=Actinokineospora TaxID=39845 RepID=UPI00166FA399|nr:MULTISPECIES: hypothetical protein [Actinokineospora]